MDMVYYIQAKLFFDSPCLSIEPGEEGNVTEKLRTQWHPAFCSAIKLELMEDDMYLDYQNEYHLNTKPLQIDLLIVKKIREVEIKNEIGKLFRTHNIIEYKSPKDSMNVSTFLKVIAYACLYKTHEKYVNDIKLDDITVTLVREAKPEKLFRWLEENGYQIDERYQGIFYVRKESCFPIQIVISKKLSKENQKWLTLLSSDLNEEDAKRVVSQIELLTQKPEKMFGDSVLQVALKENEKLFDKMRRENKDMCDALRKLMEPEMKEALAQQRKEIILKFLNAGNSAEDISRIMQIPLEEVRGAEKEMLQLV